jgi:hypothetical protein
MQRNAATPYMVAHLLFANHFKQQQGNNVSITSRFSNINVIPYLQAFQDEGISAQVVVPEATTKDAAQYGGVSDMCYLMKAQQLFVGSSVSSFARWAAIFGQAETAILYIYAYGGGFTNTTTSPEGYTIMDLFAHQWANPSLRKRVKWQLLTDDNLLTDEDE